MKKLYQVWYTPYGLYDEEEYIEGEFDSVESARLFVSSFGWVHEVSEI